MTPLGRVQATLEAAGSRRQGAMSWTCPAHDDQRASLSVKEGRDGRALLHCHAGCHPEDVLAALGLAWADLFPESRNGKKAEIITTYDYVDEHGRLLYQAVRYWPKEFRRRRPDGNGGWIWKLTGADGEPAVPLVLYRLPKVLAAVEAGQVVYVVEGERDVHAIERAGGTATTNLGGAEGKWLPEWSKLLAKTKVAVVADADDPGRKRARRIAASLQEHGGQVEVVQPATGKDTADHLAAGKTLADLQPLDQPSEAGTATSNTAAVIRVADVQSEPVEWLWAPRIPRGMLTVFDGDPGLGKSTICLELTARVTTGSPMPGSTTRTHPANVVLLSAEDVIAQVIRPRLEAAGADCNRVVVFDHVNDGQGPRSPELPADTVLLERIVDVERAALVIVDPLMAFFGAEVNAHRDQDVRRALHALKALAERTGAAVLVVRHLNKAGGSNPLYRGGGIVGAARSGLLVAPDPEDGQRRILAASKSNLAPAPA